MTPELVRQFSKYNRWMNQKVFAACSELTDQQRKGNRQLFFGSIHGTLNHILVGDLLWLGRFKNTPAQVKSLDQELYADFEELSDARSALDEAIIEWCSALTEERLSQTLHYTSMVNPQPSECDMSLAVAHFFNHQTHHRGQITTALSQLGVDVGVTDLIAMPTDQRLARKRGERKELSDQRSAASPQSRFMLAGVDLAWMGDSNPTAVAVGEFNGQCLRLTEIKQGLFGRDAILAALDAIPDLHGIAVDGPLIIENATGMRASERELGSAYGSRKAACYPSSQTRFPDALSVQLSKQLEQQGFGHLASRELRWQMECYPHPALIEIFGLQERLPYKKGAVVERRAGQANLASRLLDLVDSPVLALEVPSALLHHFDAEYIQSLGGAALKHNEDALDAVVCCYIAALYQSNQPNQVFGNTVDGYIYVPQQCCL